MIRQRVTVPSILERKSTHTTQAAAQRITMITAYDATFASIVDESGVDIILVGDSVGSVVQGVANTIPVTLEEMEYHELAGIMRKLMMEDREAFETLKEIIEDHI